MKTFSQFMETEIHTPKIKMKISGRYIYNRYPQDIVKILLPDGSRATISASINETNDKIIWFIDNNLASISSEINEDSYNAALDVVINEAIENKIGKYIFYQMLDGKCSILFFNSISHRITRAKFFVPALDLVLSVNNSNGDEGIYLGRIESISKEPSLFPRYNLKIEKLIKVDPIFTKYIARYYEINHRYSDDDCPFLFKFNNDSFINFNIEDSGIKFEEIASNIIPNYTMFVSNKRFYSSFFIDYWSRFDAAYKITSVPTFLKDISQESHDKIVDLLYKDTIYTPALRLYTKDSRVKMRIDYLSIDLYMELTDERYKRLSKEKLIPKRLTSTAKILAVEDWFTANPCVSSITGMPIKMMPIPEEDVTIIDRDWDYYGDLCIDKLSKYAKEIFQYNGYNSVYSSSISKIHEFVKELGHNSKHIWHPAEDDIIKANFSKKSATDIACMLYDRTTFEVETRAYYLGLKKNGWYPSWKAITTCQEYIDKGLEDWPIRGDYNEDELLSRYTMIIKVLRRKYISAYIKPDGTLIKKNEYMEFLTKLGNCMAEIRAYQEEKLAMGIPIDYKAARWLEHIHVSEIPQEDSEKLSEYFREINNQLGGNFDSLKGDIGFM